MKPTIWCLFSIDNLYDQPDNNLVAWWSKKPEREAFAIAFRDKLSHGSASKLMAEKAACEIWDVPTVDVRVGEASYRLEEITSGFGWTTCL